jgi:Rne/Rng family ribonuclease
VSDDTAPDTPPGTTNDTSDTTQTTSDATSRSRTRSRTRRRDTGSDSSGDSSSRDTSSDTSEASSGQSGSGDAESTDAKGGGGSDAGEGGQSGNRRKRSRRGRRGRGRGRGSGQGGSQGSGSTNGGSDTSTDADASSADGGTSRTKAKDSGGGSDKRKGTDKAGGSDNGKDTDNIRPGGTRLAAKRGSRSGGDGRSGGRRVQGVPEDVRRAMLDGPPRTMLVSVSEERTQIAILEDRTLVEHNVTRATDVTLVGNIYMARVQNVLPGMEAAFLDIGKGRNGVLYAGEVLYDDLDIEEGDAPRIEDALQPGQKVLVQVTKDAMGTKGPRLTMQLSLAGRYTVLAPNSDVFGISRKLTDKERDRLRKIVKKVKPSEHGVIVRTAAEDIPEESIIADLERLLRKWAGVEEAAKDAKALTPVYEEPPLHVKVIRDNFGPDYDKCIIDDLAVYDAVTEYLSEVAPELAAKVELYGPARTELAARERGDDQDAPEQEASRFAPLFDAYNVTEQLRKAMGRKVWLPSGGYLIIESTEAMKVIDVNTGKYTGNGKQSLEEVVLKTNLEAAEEIVRQLRLRDMGGIIIIDFIDMLLKANQDQVVRKLKRELLRDRTKTRVSDVSRLGLVQMTRKNVSAGLVESFSRTCDACDGRGFVNEFD